MDLLKHLHNFAAQFIQLGVDFLKWTRRYVFVEMSVERYLVANDANLLVAPFRVFVPINLVAVNPCVGDVRGDFVFLVAASANGGPIVLKHSRQMGDYDTLLTRAGANAATASLETRIESDHLRVLAPQANIQLAFEIRDRDATSGVAPDGSPVRYETLLLGGAEASGVAFAITPVPENESGSEAQ